MNLDFHYYATYCAAQLAGYSHEESLMICYSAQFVDCCSRTLLTRLRGPKSAATTQLNLELMDMGSDTHSLQDITRIWSSFHFLPRDLSATRGRTSKLYRWKYSLICGPNGTLAADTVKLAKGKTLQAVGLAMHVIADTWAHRYFAGTPSLVINNMSAQITEIVDGKEYPIHFRHSASKPDEPDKHLYTSCIFQFSENSIMNLGHGRAGHLPDYSFIRYRYLPAWGDYEEIVKNNPDDYYHAFCQLVYAMQYLRGAHEDFETEHYAWETVEPHRDTILRILWKRQLDDSADWAAFGQSLSGKEIPAFDIDRYSQEYGLAQDDDKDHTFLGKFFLAALAQKSMVTNRIYKSGNMLAGVSVDYQESGFQGILDFRRLVNHTEREQKHE